ncbi:molecular chaperone [Volvox carteri f. nagariensis]|uniref:Molecular chaperone n=1 Tax=Volvox carteri f. nagariensis TaxID=3068 RepID=D8U7D8_VOLCA|nr:molecular chaperone [Volvox carteri f. nagariensis]EFJ44468.1 molecular chaperone [Volvox carteri f. nagariensis]|eukprot:XP_002954575.1 molecular chaperone [Volvox carteri f. nagariensis]
MVEHTGSTSLFAIFALSLYSLFLFPYTIYRLTCGASEETVVQPYLQGKQKQGSANRVLRKVFSKSNLILIALWLLWGVLLWYVNITSKDLKPFDPFEILGVERGASTAEIKKAYRQMSLQYHPDKNPDPKAHAYFAEYITKAYQALTDEVSRKNYEVHGHPDGPQAMNVGVALPTWLFTKDSKVAPLMLLGLVGFGILLPLGVVSWYMLNSNRYSGPNGVMQETLSFYYASKYSVKEAQSLVRIPETLVCAMEFITLPTPSEQTAGLEELRKLVLRNNPDLKDKNTFWKRKASVLKAHMLLLAHLDREHDSIPPSLQADLRFVLTKSPLLLDEMIKIAIMPRPPAGYGWMTPTVAIVEMMQCVSQALSVSARKPAGGASAKASANADGMAALLQLPHFNLDVLKKLKKRRVQNIKDLQDLPAVELHEALCSAGLGAAMAEEVATFLATLPSVYCRAECEVTGEDEIMEGDVVKCRLQLLVTRPSHNTPGFEQQAPTRGSSKAIRAFTPNNPIPKDENWHLLLVDPSGNAVLSWNKVSLAEAEAVGFNRPELVEEWERQGDAAAGGDKKDAADRARSRALATADKFISRYANGARPGPATRGAVKGALTADGEAGGGADAEAESGQVVELLFHAPRAGKHELQLLIMSDSYVGSDRVIPLRVRVLPLTRAVQEGRDAKSQAKAKEWANSSDEEDGGEEGEGRRRRKGAAAAGGDGASDAGSAAGDGESDDGDEDINSDDYDSEETGELESGPEDEDDEEGVDDTVQGGKALPASTGGEGGSSQLTGRGPGGKAESDDDEDE